MRIIVVINVIKRRNLEPTGHLKLVCSRTLQQGRLDEEF